MDDSFVDTSSAASGKNNNAFKRKLRSQSYSPKKIIASQSPKKKVAFDFSVEGGESKSSNTVNGAETGTPSRGNLFSSFQSPKMRITPNARNSLSFTGKSRAADRNYKTHDPSTPSDSDDDETAAPSAQNSPAFTGNGKATDRSYKHPHTPSPLDSDDEEFTKLHSAEKRQLRAVRTLRADPSYKPPKIPSPLDSDDEEFIKLRPAAQRQMRAEKALTRNLPFTGKVTDRSYKPPNTPSPPDSDDEEFIRLRPTEQRRIRAKRAVSALRSLEADTWTPDHPKILTDRINKLLKASAINDGEQEDKHTPGSRFSASPSKKRTREEELPARSDTEPVANSTVKSDWPLKNDRPFKRLRTHKDIQAGPPIIDYTTLQPLRINYKPHPLSDRTDTWFIEMFRRLYHQTEHFVTHYFALHSLVNLDEPWSPDFSPEFIAWAEQVAEPDSATGGWDGILREGEQRKWFVMGLLVRVLRVNVFDEELFGANERDGGFLMGLEKALFTREGFSRTALRASTVRTILNGRAVTEDFYPSVANLTAQLALLLHPLTSYLYSTPPPTSSSRELPLVQDLYQSLHNLVSTAAYLSICIRFSPTIFHFNDLSPGTPYDSEETHSLEPDVFAASKQAVTDAYSSARKAHISARDNAKREIEELKKKGKGRSWKSGRAERKLAKILEKEPKPPGQSYRARAKIAAWMAISRYKAGSEEDDDDENEGLEGKGGFRIMRVCKSAAVVYYGEERRGSEGERIGLAEWVRERQGGLGMEGREVVGRVLAVAALGAAAFGLNQVVSMMDWNLVGSQIVELEKALPQILGSIFLRSTVGG